MSQCYLEPEFKRYAKIQAVFPSHLDMALSRMSSILISNLCISETVMISPSEPCTEATVPTNAVLV